jgi:hypothetical protein
MGRPPIGKHALSGAERQRRYLAKLLAGKPSVTKPTQADEAKDKARIRELEAEVARLLAGKPSVTKPAQPGGHVSSTRSQRRETDNLSDMQAMSLRAEIRLLKSDNLKLKAALQLEPDVAKLRKKVVGQQVEMASLRSALKQAAKERDKYRSHVAHVRPKKYIEARQLLTRRNHVALVKALHSDRLKQCSADELAAAERIAVALRPLFDEYQSD